MADRQLGATCYRARVSVPALTRPRFGMTVVTLLLVGAACTSTPPPRAEPTTSGPTRTSSGGATTTSVAPEAPTSAVLRSPIGGSLLVRGTYPRVGSRCVRYQRPQ